VNDICICARLSFSEQIAASPGEVPHRPGLRRIRGSGIAMVWARKILAAIAGRAFIVASGLAMAGLQLACGETVLAVDAIDRLTAERLEAIHQAVLKLNAARHEMPRPGPLREYRANLHVHSAWSHDSRGKIDDIVAAARAAGTQVLMFTEHPASHYDVFTDGHQGNRDEVLLIPGAETKGMLVYPRQAFKEFEEAKTQDMSDIVRGREGLTFLSHLEERMDWEILGLTGVEIYNTHADVKDEKRLVASMKSPLWLLKTAELYRRYPQESFSALHDYPADYLKRWDLLCQQAPHTGVSANDAHQNIGITAVLVEGNQVRIEDALGEQLLLLDKGVFHALKEIPADAKAGETLFQMRLDPYENSLRHVGTHLLLTELTQPAVWQALNSGRAFVAFDWMADSRGFDFAARSECVRYEMGSDLTFRDGQTLTGQSSLSAHWKLIRNGEPLRESEGSTFEFPVTNAGNYRVELWLDVAGEKRIWILSNPIYISAR
jgi:hypothetical protein